MPLASPARLASQTARVVPFALPQLHVGTDICRVERIYDILVTPLPEKRMPEARRAHARTPAGPQSVNSPFPPTALTRTAAQTTAARFIRRILSPAEVHALGDSPPPVVRLPTPSPVRVTVAWLARGGSGPLMVGTDNADEASRKTSRAAMRQAAQFLAGRFAAKEAVIKAHPHLRGLTMHSIRIERRHDDDLDRNGSGPPRAFVRLPTNSDKDTGMDGSSGSSQEQKKGTLIDVVDQEARLSISHDGDYATAVCIGFENLSEHGSPQTTE